jgi:glycosyltransferase involved in cell wall biosynthesis
VRIFGWRADPGTAYWRLNLPLVELASQGHDCMVADVMPECVRHDAEVDVVVASRTAMPQASKAFQQMCREARMLMVYECDDDFFTVEPHNRVAYELFSRPDIAASIRANMAAAHLVTVSTEHLAERVAEHTSAPIVVLPNRVPRWLTELPAPEPHDGRVSFGHTGGISHLRDFGEIVKPLRAFLQHQGDGAEFVAYGTDSTPRVASIRGRTRHADWTEDVRDYLRSLVGLDVGLAPLRDTVFNRSKSPLKPMEFGALGLPVIASPAGPYRDYVRDGSTGYLCRTAKDWSAALNELMSPWARAEMGAAGRAQARENLIEDHAHLWLDAYEGAMSGRVAA